MKANLFCFVLLMSAVSGCAVFGDSPVDPGYGRITKWDIPLERWLEIKFDKGWAESIGYNILCEQTPQAAEERRRAKVDREAYIRAAKHAPLSVKGFAGLLAEIAGHVLYPIDMTLIAFGVLAGRGYYRYCKKRDKQGDQITTPTPRSTMGEKTKVWPLRRTFEWLLAVTWLVYAFNAVAHWDPYAQRYDFYWDDVWLPLALFVPGVGPVIVKLFSLMVAGADGMNAQQRFALLVLLAFGVGIALAFRPSGYKDLIGFFLPMAFYALAVFLWLGWRRKIPATGKSTNVERIG